MPSPNSKVLIAQCAIAQTSKMYSLGRRLEKIPASFLKQKITRKILVAYS